VARVGVIGRGTVGDAAHATSPRLGQGPNLALMDALVLAESVSARATIADALALYEVSRRPHFATTSA